jgi:hypothetical protein
MTCSGQHRRRLADVFSSGQALGVAGRGVAGGAWLILRALDTSFRP